MAKLYMLEDFVAEEEGELTASKDEVLNIIEPDADGWTYVQNQNGEVGLVPSSFTVVLEPEEAEYNEDNYQELDSGQNQEEPEPQEVSPPPITAHPLDIPQLSVPDKTTERKKKRTSIAKVASIISPRKHLENKHQKESLLISNPSHPSGHPPSIVASPVAKSPRKSEKNLVQLTPVILRVFTNEEIHKEIEERDLSNDKILRTFKSIRATGQTPVRHIIDEVARKLLLADSRQFHLYIIDRKGKTIINTTNDM